jgi:hypothetical protein
MDCPSLIMLLHETQASAISKPKLQSRHFKTVKMMDCTWLCGPRRPSLLWRPCASGTNVELRPQMHPETTRRMWHAGSEACKSCRKKQKNRQEEVGRRGVWRGWQRNHLLVTHFKKQRQFGNPVKLDSEGRAALTIETQAQELLFNHLRMWFRGCVEQQPNHSTSTVSSKRSQQLLRRSWLDRTSLTDIGRDTEGKC